MVRQKIGQYRVLERLGNGGMGSVYRAVDELLGRDVALKVLDTTLQDSAARLRAEAAALARLSHPGIATVYELVEDDERLVMVMELVRGQTLQHILDDVGVFSPRRAAELCMQALAALEHAHAAGVVHRDLKPGNLMLTENGSIKIMDFGIARLDGAVTLTGANSMIGTPAYMAPEQVLGHPVDPRADLYAMGVVFFRLITAALPFKGETPFDMAQAQVRDAPAKATHVRPDLPSWADDIITRALAKAPAARFQSAVEFHEAFALAIADMPLVQSRIAPAVEATEIMERPHSSLTPAVPQPVATEAPRHPRITWLTAAAGAAVLTAAAWILTPSGAASPDAAGDTPTAVADADAKPSPTPAIVPAASATDRETNAPAPTPAGLAKPATTAERAKTQPVPEAGHLSAKAALPTASFTGVKLLTVAGARTTSSDATVDLSEAEISVRSTDAKIGASALRYQQITRATYVHARDPKWDPLLSGPTGKIDVPGILGRARHWLVLQGKDAYVILRLDTAHRQDIMKAFEDRTGIAVERIAPGGKQPE